MPKDEKPVAPPARKPEGEDVAKAAQEMGTLRKKLEEMALRGDFDLRREEIRDMHQRLDKLEAFVHTQRRMPQP